MPPMRGVEAKEVGDSGSVRALSSTHRAALSKEWKAALTNRSLPVPPIGMAGCHVTDSSAHHFVWLSYSGTVGDRRPSIALHHGYDNCQESS